MGFFGMGKKDEQGEPRTYTVKAGDTLSEIAHKLNVDVLSLEAANVGVTKGRPSTIYPGQVLHVPRGYGHKPVLKDRTVGVPAVHVDSHKHSVHVPTLSVDRGHKDVNLPTPTVETHKKAVTVPTWSLERHDKVVEVPTVSLGKQDHHVSVPTAKVSAHNKEVDVKTYSLGTHQKDVNVKVPGVEAHRKESGYGSTWNPNTPIPETAAERKLHDERRAANQPGGKFLGIFGGGDKHPNAGDKLREAGDKVKHEAHKAGNEIDKRTPDFNAREDKKGGFFGFGGQRNREEGMAWREREDENKKDFLGVKRFQNQHEVASYGVEVERKEERRVGKGLLLLAVAGGAYLVYKSLNKDNHDHSDTSDRRAADIRREVKEVRSSEVKPVVTSMEVKPQVVSTEVKTMRDAEPSKSITMHDKEANGVLKSSQARGWDDDK